MSLSLKELREALKPKGSKPIVRLDLINHFFNYNFIKSCIDVMVYTNAVGGSLNPLEKLGVILLFDSAGVDVTEKGEEYEAGATGG
jgi:hypothetical protein